MIRFSGKFTAIKVEQKSIAKRSGGNFDFVEVELEEKSKKPTTIIARVSDKVTETFVEGSIYDLDIVVTSWKSDAGKVWNNFVIMDCLDVQHGQTAPAQPAPAESYADDDEIPF
jgi:hypothetical protein